MAIEMVRPIRLADGGKRGLRTQFGAVCWRRRKDRVELLLVSTRDDRRWVIPKGWPMDGKTPARAAAIEAWEEAGVAGRGRPVCIGLYTYLKRPEDDGLPVVVAVFPLEVTRMARDWPERAQRKRRWVSRKKAAKLVGDPELARLLRDFTPPGT